MAEEDLAEMLSKCLEILDENLDTLCDIDDHLEDEKEDVLEPGMGLHELIDMTEDVALSSKIKKAQSNFMKRQSEPNF